MARLLRDRVRDPLGDSRRRESNGGNTSFRLSSSTSSNITASVTVTEDLPSPFGSLNSSLTDKELKETAYEIFVGACRTTGSKPLTYISQSERGGVNGTTEKLTASPSMSSSSTSSTTTSSSFGLHRSLTSTAASKMKKAFGLKSTFGGKVKSESGGGGKERKKPVTVGEMVRVQMGVSEQMDSRIRRGLLRVSAGQLGRRIESMVLPLELLQQFKASDFPDQLEYESWRSRLLKILEAGLLLHPHLPLDKSDSAAHRLRDIIRGASDRPLETGRNSESMQVLRSAVTSLACRSFDSSSSDAYHWADGFPLNLHLYHMLLESCFDNNEDGSIIEEVDDVLDMIKKTWGIFGINQELHNLCFTWAIFHRFVTSGQVANDLLFAADDQLAEIARDAKGTKDTTYSKILSSILSSILGWTEKRLLAYHDTFNSGNVEIMECIVSLGVSAARILVEDISHEYRRRRREEVDVARSRIDTYIRSSLRTAFAQRMEEADASRRSRTQASPAPLLCVLAKEIGSLASKEKEVFTPILKKWHPLSAGVAVATLHVCYGNELKQFISGVTELTPDSVQVLQDADKLEKQLVQIAVEESVDSEDGGKAIIREMPPYEAEYTVISLARTWIKTRVDRLKQWIDRNLQQETWKANANKGNFAASAVDALRVVDEALDAFFRLPIPMHASLLPDLVSGLDRSIQQYISKAKTGCGTKNTFIPALPALTRCTTESKFGWKKKEKPQQFPKMKSQVGTLNDNGNLNVQQLCVRMNTLQHLRVELENLEKRTITSLRNSESAETDVVNGLTTSFGLSIAACQEGIQQLCEATAYMLVFHNLSHVLYDSLYVGEVTTSRIYPLLKELDPNLEMISNTVHDRVRNRLVTAIMKATFDGFLLVLLSGGPSRAFSREDSQILEDDFKSIKDLFLADGDGLPEELVEKASTQVRNVLPLFRTDTESLIDRFRRMMTEAYGPAAKSRPPVPPTTGHWNPTEPNTILRVLCYRNDEAASKFLKKTYGLPKKL